MIILVQLFYICNGQGSLELQLIEDAMKRVNLLSNTLTKMASDLSHKEALIQAAPDAGQYQ